MNGLQTVDVQRMFLHRGSQKYVATIFRILDKQQQTLDILAFY